MCILHQVKGSKTADPLAKGRLFLLHIILLANKQVTIPFHLTRCLLRSVSYPAPAYYAHLVTDRARAHLAGGKYNVSDGASSTGAQARHILADILADISPHQLTKKKMYWV